MQQLVFKNYIFAVDIQMNWHLSAKKMPLMGLLASTLSS